MSNYTQVTFFGPKDALTTGNAAKLIKGVEVDAELAAIASAILSKLDSADLLTSILAQDGAGSGIDADTVDGQHAVALKALSPNVQASNYTTVLSDAGNMIKYTGSGDTHTIAANASVAYPTGSTITFVNRGGTTLSIAITSDTLRLAGTSVTGSRTLAINGIATAVKIDTTEWLISGTGLS